MRTATRPPRTFLMQEKPFLLEPGHPPGIRWRFFRLLFVLFCLGFVVLGAAEVQLLYRQNLDQYGQRALAISRMVASLPQVQDHLTQPDAVQVINPLVNRLRSRIEADFIVVGNRQGIRVAHPLPERIGQPMVGGDNDLPFSGKEIINTAQGSLGESIRGKVPVFDRQGAVIGVVSTGYLLPNLRGLTGQVALSLLPWFALSMLMALLGSWWVGGRIKAAMHQMEPEQIASLVDQYRTVLDAIEDAVLVIDRDQQVILMNPRAREHLKDPQSPSFLFEVWPEVCPLVNQHQCKNVPVGINNLPVLVTVYPMGEQHVITFRDQRDIMRVAEELTSVKRYTELLRAQTHEHQNQLQILAGLIHLGQEKEALQWIQKNHHEHDEIQEALQDLQFSRLKALLIGKYAYAREKNIQLVLEPGSFLGQQWEHTHADEILLVTGNLIENAIEAVAGRQGAEVRVFIGEDPLGLQIEVIDNGPGIPEEDRLRVFQRGHSTKGTGRGIGLALVQQHLEARGGSIHHDRKQQRTHFLANFPNPLEDDHAL